MKPTRGILASVGLMGLAAGQVAQAAGLTAMVAPVPEGGSVTVLFGVVLVGLAAYALKRRVK